MRKIVILGPESTGKTTLADQLSRHYDCAMIPEFARNYLYALGRPYTYDDLLEIAKGQVALEEKVMENDASKNVIFLDTDLIVIKIWSQYRFKKCHKWVEDQVRARIHDFYLLTYPDVEWKTDPLREHPGKRQEIFRLYENDLHQRNVSFSIVKGEGTSRFEHALDAVEKFLATG